MLAGDGTFDPKNYLGVSPPTYIPAYLADVDSSLGETAADNRFVSVSGGDFLPDMHLGRLAVNSAAEAAVVVNKVLAYEQNPLADGWNRKVMFVAVTTRPGVAYIWDINNLAPDARGRITLTVVINPDSTMIINTASIDSVPELVSRVDRSSSVLWSSI